MASVKCRRVFVNKQQKEALVEYIQRNPLLKNPSKLSNKLSKKDLNKLWEDLAIHLNKIGEITGGAVKDTHTWKKTWQDMKSNVKKKVSETRKYAMGTGGGPPLPEMDVESSVEDEKIKEILDPMLIEGDRFVLESDVVFEIVAEPDTVNKFEEDLELEQPSTSVSSLKLEKPIPSATRMASNKSKRLAETLKVSAKISEEIAAKTSVKQDYYREKLQILKENIKVKKEKLQLKKQDIEVKREISSLLRIIVQRGSPHDSLSESFD